MLILIATVFLFFSLVYGMWIMRNYKVFHQLLFAEVSRAASWQTNWPSYKDEFEKYQNKYKDGGNAFINWIKENPRKYFELCLKRLKIFLLEPCVKGVSFRHKVVSSFIFFTIYPLGYLGLAKSIRQRNTIAFLALLFISSKIILHVLIGIEGELRYRLPVELLITIFAAYGLSTIRNLILKAKAR